MAASGTSEPDAPVSAAIAFAVLSMSAASETGDDAAYLEWHMLDHLPEQYRIDTLRLGTRWVVTEACAASRAAAVAPFDDVAHLVAYLFADPVSEGLREFFALGKALHEVGRMPLSLPRRHVGGYEVAARRANPAAGVIADVVPWRPSRGLYLLVEQVDGGSGDAWTDAELAELAGHDGVAGAWALTGTSGRHPAFSDAEGSAVVLAHLDGRPDAVAATLTPWLEARWASGRATPLLATPMVSVEPWRWNDAVPA